MKKILLILAMSFVFSFTVSAKQKVYDDIKHVTIVSVYDGDTFKVNIPGYPDIVGKEISIRLYGIDTPEKRGTSGYTKELALKARTFVYNKLHNAKRIVLKNVRRGKYFRIIADVYVDGENLSQLLINEGLAKPYFGGKKPKW